MMRTENQRSSMGLTGVSLEYQGGQHGARDGSKLRVDHFRGKIGDGAIHVAGNQLDDLGHTWGEASLNPM
jgi:hypothetical protein